MAPLSPLQTKMKVPIEYLGIAVVIVSFWETDEYKKRRLFVLAKLLKEQTEKPELITEALMACMDMALTPEWKKFVKMMKGRFLCCIDGGRPEDPTSIISDLFYWLQECWQLVLQDKLTEACLDIKGGYLLCR